MRVGDHPLTADRRTRYAARVRSEPPATMTLLPKRHPIVLSIGIMAWNEEGSILNTLESLFRQSAFEKFVARREVCEILILANGWTDRTVPIVREFLERIERDHPSAEGFVARVIAIPEAGR